MKRLVRKTIYCSLFLLHSSLLLTAQTNVRWGDWQTWGEQADNTYRNPLIPADYSDLDCIRVGEDYYAISSTMQFSPGMTILHSKDLVNWEIAGNAVTDLTQIGSALSWKEMDRYGRGIWAGTLRHHKGRFYLYFGTPDEGFFMTSAPKAEGPWEPLTPLLKEGGWDDCTALWDEKGRAWFVGTRFADNYKTYLFRMAKNGRSIDRKSARLINEGNGREANKLLYHDGYYYLIFSEHRNGIGRYVMAKRDREITGSFAEEKQLLLPCVDANEPNQGGIIEGPDGNWYFLTHHGSGDWSGRIVSLLPVEWRDGWPMMGDLKQGEPGAMVWQAPLPLISTEDKLQMQLDGDFDGPVLGPQWQWNYQPRSDKFSLTERPGWLRLYAFQPLEKNNLLKAGNTLTVRSFRSAWNEVTIRMDLSGMADGQHAGLCHFAAHSGCLGVVREGGKTFLERRNDEHSERFMEITQTTLWLRSTWGLEGRSHFAYSTDSIHFDFLGDYRLSWGYYRGDRIGIYSYNDLSESGYVDVDYLRYDIKRQIDNPFGHALVPDMNADASIELIDSTFYCYATTDGYGRGLETSGPPVVWKSNDFVHWSFDGICFPSADGEKYWAPSKAVEHKGRWYIYPTVNGIMHVGVADSPDGPFRLARGEDHFAMPYAEEATLLKEGDRGGIDAEIFIDDDGQAYAFWGRRHVARLADDMMTIDTIRTLQTRRKEYSEGPIFFKRNGIYYYLYTIGGDENYEYYYMMSRTSPLGPYETPAEDRVSTTCVERGVFGPGHGCVFNVGEDYYFAFLEFSRRSTNRQTYVNRLEFNPDGTIRPVEVSLDGVGALSGELSSVHCSLITDLFLVSASSTAPPLAIRHNKDERCQRTEQFVPLFAFDGANGSRWMAADGDTDCWLMADFGKETLITRSELCFVRPTQGHAYALEGSKDGVSWQRCGGHADIRRQSPHTDAVGHAFRYLRVRITAGIPGVWEWRIYN